MRSFCFFLKIAESHLLCDTFLDLHDPHIWWIPNSRTFWRKYGKNPSHIKNRRIPNHEPELFHAVFSPPPKKKNKFHPKKSEKKNRVSTAKSNHHQPLPLLLPWWQILKIPWVYPPSLRFHLSHELSTFHFANPGSFFREISGETAVRERVFFPKCVSFQVAGGTPNRNLKPWASQTQASPNSRL